jgi:hypothetical protein
MQGSIQKYTGIFFYKNKQIQFHFWKQADSLTPDIIIFLGTAQTGKIPKWVAEAAPAGVIVVDGLPHWEADPNGLDLKDFSIKYTQSAFKAVFDKFNISTINVIASSQAVPGVIWVTRQILPKIRNIGLISPLGYTPDIFGNSPKSRINKLRIRALKSIFQYSQSAFHDLRNIYIHFILLRALFLEKTWDSSDKKYAAGLTSNLLKDSNVIAEELWRRDNILTIFLGKKDKVFPTEEVLSSLKASNSKHIRTFIFPNMAHSSLAIRGNRKILVEIIKTVRN